MATFNELVKNKVKQLRMTTLVYDILHGYTLLKNGLDNIWERRHVGTNDTFHLEQLVEIAAQSQHIAESLQLINKQEEEGNDTVERRLRSLLASAIENSTMLPPSQLGGPRMITVEMTQGLFNTIKEELNHE